MASRQAVARAVREGGRECAPLASSDEEVTTRVLFLYDHLGYPRGATHGLTRYCVDTLPSLNQGNIKLTACFLREPHPAAAALEERGVSPIFLGRGKWDPRALTDVLALVREHRIEVVHAVGQKGILVGRTAARIAECACVTHLCDVFPLNPVLRAAFRFTARWTDLTLTVSEAVRHYAIDEYGSPARDTSVLYNGIALENFRRSPPSAAAAWRARHGIAADAKLVGVIGRLSSEKGHDRLLRQVPRIARAVPGVQLVIVGDGPLRDALEREIIQSGLSGTVRLTGQQADIATVMSALDVVAIPSRHEGLCRVALEALAVGTPVVATTVGGLPEALAGGRHGMLVPAGDDEALGDAIVRILGDAALSAGLLEGAQAHVARFSHEASIVVQREIYHELAHHVRVRRGRGLARSTQ